MQCHIEDVFSIPTAIKTSNLITYVMLFKVFAKKHNFCHVTALYKPTYDQIMLLLLQCFTDCGWKRAICLNCIACQRRNIYSSDVIDWQTWICSDYLWYSKWSEIICVLLCYLCEIYYVIVTRLVCVRKKFICTVAGCQIFRNCYI